MADNRIKCGPDTFDEYDKYSRYSDNTYRTTHYVSGSGVMTSNSASKYSFYKDTYYINSGITELGDSCLSKCSIVNISLPDTLVKIGSSCFRYSSITSVSLPESLTEIGHTNFPATLTSITIPAKLNVFPTDNLYDCKDLKAIGVNEKNKAFKCIDGLLYNYDVSEVLLCPRGKSGKIIIPNSVKRIAEKCFHGCKKLTMIEIPRSVESIGSYAFSELTLDRLIIPNTVTSIGEGCFAKTCINKSFRFPQGIKELPNKCFESAVIPSTDFLKNIEVIGDECFFFYSKNGFFPEYLRLPKIKHIGAYAFDNVQQTKYIELSSTLAEIGEYAFSSMASDLKIIYISFTPNKISRHALDGISDDATLYVPQGTEVMYKNASPWSTISHIEEFDPSKDIQNENYDISDELHFSRLNNIVYSIKNADRIYLSEILHDIALSYQNVDNDNDYDEAMEVIMYNNKFVPPLIPYLEKEICTRWTNKYKLRLASTFIFDICATPIILPNNDTNMYIEQRALTEIPMLNINNVEKLCDIQGMPSDVNVHFNDIIRYLQNELSLAESSIKIAVSWFTNYALSKQIKKLALKGIKIELIINNDSVNNGGYCLDFNELIDNGVHISLIEYPHLIHHKFCIIDNKVVINGSYNWTRFSEHNYENIMIFRNNDYIIRSFNEEFEKMLQKAEHKDIKEMPESVPQRPEYDRNAFKQYVTEELDAEARETSEQRDKITALQKAAKLNPEYFEKLNPKVNETLGEAFNVVEQSDTITKDIAAMVGGKSLSSSNNIGASTIKQNSIRTNNGQLSTTQTVYNPPTQPARTVITKEEKTVVEKFKASDLFMVLDVSGSMSQTYTDGHVYSITKKVVSVALAVSESKEVSLWKFGTSSSFVKNIGVENLSDINDVKCANSGTDLNQFVTKADSSIKDNSLVIIFTDDDGASISGAVGGMKDRANVFWQIIVYGQHQSISSAINGIPNISLVNMVDYPAMNDSEINQALLKDYINWKK